MQIKKEDIKQTILQCAKDEFIIHGYEGSSLRTIAKKANTSLGNIYHYYPNKKAMLDCLLKPVIANTQRFLEMHIDAHIEITDVSQIEAYLDVMDFDSAELRSILSKEFVILMETKEDEYVEAKNQLLKIFRSHVAMHLRCKDIDNHFVAIVTKMIVDCIIHVVKCGECTKAKRQEIIDMFNMLCKCVAVNELAQEIEEDKKRKEN